MKIILSRILRFKSNNSVRFYSTNITKKLGNIKKPLFGVQLGFREGKFYEELVIQMEKSYLSYIIGISVILAFFSFFSKLFDNANIIREFRKKSKLYNSLKDIIQKVFKEKHICIINYDQKLDSQYLTSYLNHIYNNKYPVLLTFNNHEISQNDSDFYNEFKKNNTIFYSLNVAKLKDKGLIETIQGFSSYLFIQAINDKKVIDMLDHKKFSIVIAIEGIENYMKKMDLNKRSEILDYLVDFQKSFSGNIIFYGCSKNIIEELNLRKCKTTSIHIPDEYFKDEYCQIIYQIFSKYSYLSTENLEVVYHILGLKSKRLKKFFDEFVKITDEKSFVYNNYYIKSQIKEIFHHKNIKLKNQLHNFDLNFLKNYKNCEKFTKNPNLLIEGNTEICLIEESPQLDQLIDLNVLEQNNDYYYYTDRLKKFFCQNL